MVTAYSPRLIDQICISEISAFEVRDVLRAAREDLGASSLFSYCRGIRFRNVLDCQRVYLDNPRPVIDTENSRGYIPYIHSCALPDRHRLATSTSL
jgi:hypothetical protein